MTILARFRQVVAAQPDAIALVGESVALTYAQVTDEVARRAAALRAQGVSRGEAVVFARERSVDAVLLELAIIACGAAFVPLDPHGPAPRWERMLRPLAASRRTRVVVDHPALEATAIACGATTLQRVDGVALASLTHDAHALDRALDVGPDEAAYVMFTSGSTGEPKGVLVPHRAIERLVCDVDYARLGPGRVLLHAAPLAFDASTFEVWGALLTGGCCVVHDERLPTAAGLGRAIRAHGVTTLWLTAGLFNAIIDEDATQLAGLDELLIGGEALSVPHVRRALDLLPRTTIINGYGPTETTTFAATWRVTRPLAPDVTSIPIGVPVPRTTLTVCDDTGAAVPDGFVGELRIGGDGVALGYVRDDDGAPSNFGPDPENPARHVYRTGDLVRRRPDGALEFVGRRDAQLKISGHRIEPAEIERVMAGLAGVAAAAVVAVPRGTTETPRLVAFLVPTGAPLLDPHAVRDAARAQLPAPMVPAEVRLVAQFPLTANGKLDRRALIAEAQTAEPTVAPGNAEAPWSAETHAPLVAQLCADWSALLGTSITPDTNVFDAGATSMLVVRFIARLSVRDGRDVPAIRCFEHPTPRGFARALLDQTTPPLDATAATRSAPMPRADRDDRRVAIVGAAVRYPGADTLAAFWERLLAPEDAITHFTEASLDPEVPAQTRATPGYVPARGVLEGVEGFDAAFFGISPREAQLTDPQQRLWLELAWEALEDAALVADRSARSVGVFGGVYNSAYLARALTLRPELVEAYGGFNAMLLNEKDYVAPRVAHRLGLRGPAVSVHTACSTSLVAVVQAVQALREHSCDVALAGGVALTLPVRSGYVHQEGSMLSPDGRTRPFDADAAGTVFSDGAGVVVLKRLVDAQRDSDRIYAVIAGVGINNDGAERASFSAPSVAGQVDVVRRALQDAGCSARDVSYVEAHGTATPLGDPIEFEALRRVFEADGVAVGNCRLGSVKGHIGHTVIAAGVAGLLKSTLALQHERLPGTANHRSPLPALRLETSPFRIPTAPEPWPVTDTPRRAGVSSFGVGGTNAHVILEEAPRVMSAVPTLPDAPDPLCILPLSARTATAADEMMTRLADALEMHADADLPAVAETLQHGRAMWPHRRAVVARTRAEAIVALRGARGDDQVRGDAAADAPAITVLFAGQGAQRPGMTRALYASEPAFRNAFDTCASIVRRHTGRDLRAAIDDGASLEQTSVAQPALFATAWALAALWQQRGVTPQRFIGHSVGEFVAAALAGVFSLEDAVHLVCRRGELMQAMPPGLMLAVALDEATLRARLPDAVSIAAINAATQCVVSGPTPDVQAFREALEADGVLARPLRTSHAFHSAMMDPVLPAFGDLVASVTLSAPTRPIVSTVTGRPLDAATATDPGYWTRHLRETVRFADAMAHAAHDSGAVFLELGPAATLTSLARRVAPALRVVPSLDGTDDEPRALARAAAQLWAWGALTPWSDRPRRQAPVSLPTYPFERERCWVDAPPRSTAAAAPPPADRAGSAAPIVALASLATPHEPSSSMSAPSLSTDRPARLAREVLALVEDVAGLPVRDADPATRFTALGLDSLVLTQLALAVSRRYGVKIAFRQLLESLASASVLAAHLDAALPAEATVAAPEAPPPALPTAADTPLVPRAPAHASAPTSPAVLSPALPMLDGGAGLPDGIAQVIAQQLQLMQQQLTLLTGGVAMRPDAATATAGQPADAPAPVPAPTDTRTDTRAGTSADATSPDAPAVGPNRGVYDATKAFGAAMRVTVTDHADGLSPRQRARLDAFIRRYTARTAGSKRYTATHRDGMADPRAVTGFRPLTKELVYPIVVERSRGARVWDIDGNEYIDVLSGFGSNLLGWTPDVVTEALRAQLDRGFEVGPQHVLAGEVATKFRALTGAERVAFCNTGSEAVLGAIRIARTVTGRPLVAMFSGAYHGINDEVIVRPRPDGRAMPAAPGILPEATRNAIVLDWANPESLRTLETRADEIAAVLVEPVQSRRPDVQPREFLEALRDLTARTGIVFIWDEIVTGFRAAPGGAQELFGIRGDLATYGKIVGGGFPIGVIAGKREFMDALDGGPWQYGDASVPEVGVTYFAGTFVRHPLALAAARAMLDELTRQGPALQDTLASRTTAVADAINARARELGAPVQVRHFRSVWKTFITADTPHGDLLFYALRERGLHIYDGFPCFMTAAHGDAECAAIVDAFAGAMEEMLEGRFLPRVASSDDAPSEPIGSEPPSATRASRPVRAAQSS